MDERIQYYQVDGKHKDDVDKNGDLLHDPADSGIIYTNRQSEEINIKTLPGIQKSACVRVTPDQTFCEMQDIFCYCSFCAVCNYAACVNLQEIGPWRRYDFTKIPVVQSEKSREDVLKVFYKGKIDAQFPVIVAFQKTQEGFGGAHDEQVVCYAILKAQPKKSKTGIDTVEGAPGVVQFEVEQGKHFVVVIPLTKVPIAMMNAILPTEAFERYYVAHGTTQMNVPLAVLIAPAADSSSGVDTNYIYPLYKAMWG